MVMVLVMVALMMLMLMIMDDVDCLVYDGWWMV